MKLGIETKTFIYSVAYRKLRDKKPYRIDFYGRNRSVRMDGEKPF